MEKEHAFKTIDKDIKEGAIRNLLLFFGKEQYLVNWSINNVINKYVNEAYRALDYTRLEPEKVTVDSIIESCETLSMFSDRRVVVLPDFPPLWGGRLKGYTDEEEKTLIAYIQNLPESCFLIFTAETADRRKKLYKTIVAAGKSYDFGPLDEKQLRSFIAKRFKLAGKGIRNSVVEELVQCSGYYHKDTEYTLWNLENDIKKIIAHSEGEEILLSDVLQAVSGNLETNVFAMVDAISRGRKDEAYRLLFNILAAGESVYKLLALIASQFELILEVRELKEEGRSPSDMHKILDVHEFRIKKALGFAARYQTEHLKRILGKLYRVDSNIKTGLLTQELALELFIAEI